MKELLFVLLFLFSLSAYSQLILPGDYPDPSVTKVGQTYWASATTSNWAPIYPLLKSEDLIHWETTGFVFNQPPQWADYYFWAPEISYDKGKVYIYYSAHKRNGNLCIGIASADKPEGPYTDHGPLMCQEVGSIDAFPIRDENDKLFLVWKEDANSVGKPTPIWLSELKEDRSSLVGEKVELFRNDKPWESNLVEGVSMLRHGDYFYAFYAAAACCGGDCSYATGIARSKTLTGPWEKFDKNPILKNEGDWNCPGHGTPVEKDGKFYFLYHGYNKGSFVYAGRQGLLKEFVFTEDGWIKFVNSTDAINVTIPKKLEDEFDTPALSAIWQWSVFDTVQYQQKNGALHLHASKTKNLTFLGQKTYSSNYTVVVSVDAKASNAEAGVAAIGDDQNMISATYLNGQVRVWKRQLGKDTFIAEEKIDPKKLLYLKMDVSEGKNITFKCSQNGKNYKVINKNVIDGAFLPPWDRAVRAGIVSKGESGQVGVFENFILYH